MRVLLLNSESPPLGGRATLGAEALARGLARHGAVVDLVTLGEHEERVAEVHWDGTAPEEGALTVHRVRRHRGSHRGEVGGMLDYLLAALPLTRRLQRTGRYDVVQVFSPSSTAAILPFLNLRSIPVVVSLYAADIPGYDSHPGLARRLRRPLSRWIWRRAHRVVVTSESLGRLALHTVPDLRYSVIHHGVDLTRFRPRSAQQIRASHRFRCLTVSLIGDRPLADLIRAIGSLPGDHFELEIVGRGSAEPELRALVSSLGLEDRVSFAGAVEGNQLSHNYRNADLFAISSWETAFDSGLAEALASGLPIVGPEGGCIPSLVQHGRNGLLIPPRDPTALAGAIGRLAGDQILRSRFGHRSRVEAETSLSWERITARYLSIYDGVRSGVSAPALLAELPTSTW